MGFNLTLQILVYYKEKHQNFGLKILNIEFPLVTGNEAELAFNNFCEKLEKHNLLGKQLCEFKDGKAYFIQDTR